MYAGETCSQTCNPGFTLAGAPLHCQANGTVTGAQKCVPNACSVAAPRNGEMGQCNTTLASGASCQFVCHDHYYLQGNASTCYAGRMTYQTCGGGPAAAVITNVTADVSVGSSTFRQQVFFTPGARNDSTILGWQVLTYPGGQVSTVTEPTARSLSVSSLTPGVAYSHTVTALVSFGTGAPSPTVTCYAHDCSTPNCPCLCQACTGQEATLKCDTAFTAPCAPPSNQTQGLYSWPMP